MLIMHLEGLLNLLAIDLIAFPLTKGNASSHDNCRYASSILDNCYVIIQNLRYFQRTLPPRIQLKCHFW